MTGTILAVGGLAMFRPRLALLSATLFSVLGATTASEARASDEAAGSAPSDVPVSVYQPPLAGSALHAGEPAPAGYHVETGMREDLLVTGAALFGGTYLLSVVVALTERGSTSLLVPIVGPLLQIGKGSGSTRDDVGTVVTGPWIGFVLVVDALAQACGAGTLVAGLASERRILVRDLPVAIRATPMRFGRDGTGLGLSGSLVVLMTRTSFAHVVTLAVAVSTVGCNAKSPLMVPTSHFPIRGSSDAATLVIVRPSGFKGEDLTTIIDGHGRFLGEGIAQAYFAVRLPPGENVLVSCASNTSVLKATLSPGRIYFVEISSELGFLTTYFHLLAIRPGRESWSRLDRWMTASAAFVPDEPAGQRTLASSSRADQIAQCLRRVRLELEAYGPEELRAHTLGPDDGR